jgi:type IV secretory pathway VirB4 component
LANKPQAFSTQEFIAFSEIHEGIVITKKGELRAILMASSINFSLKSEQEQTAIVYAYQNFLNSLTFPVQIMMQSRRLDLSKYMGKLKKTAEAQANELLRNQTYDYMDFIERLIKMANIMDKKFFVVVPYMPPVAATSGKQSFFSPKKQTSSIQITPDQFTKYRQELSQRIQVIQSGLGAIGVRSAQLNTQQIVELMYGIYNPEEAAKEKLINFNNLNSDMVESELEKPEDSK